MDFDFLNYKMVIFLVTLRGLEEVKIWFLFSKRCEESSQVCPTLFKIFFYFLIFFVLPFLMEG